MSLATWLKGLFSKEKPVSPDTDDEMTCLTPMLWEAEAAGKSISWEIGEDRIMKIYIEDQE